MSLTAFVQPTREALENGRADLIEAGRLLFEARSKAKRGEWLPHLKEIDIAGSTATRYIRQYRASTQYNFRYPNRSKDSDMPTKGSKRSRRKPETKPQQIKQLLIAGKSYSEIEDVLGVCARQISAVARPLRNQGLIPEKISVKHRQSLAHVEIKKLETIFLELFQYCGDILRGSALSAEARQFLVSPRNDNEQFLSHSIRHSIQGIQDVLSRLERELWPDGQKVKPAYLLQG